MPFSLRLDRETEAQIRRLSADTGRSRSAVVREAVAHYLSTREAGARLMASAYDRLKPFVGLVSTGGANLSTDTHVKYRESLRARHRRAKRSR